MGESILFKNTPTIISVLRSNYRYHLAFRIIVNTYFIYQLKPFLINFGKMLSGTTSAQVISILFAPIITHIFSPETYGILGLYIYITTLPVMISTLRYHLAILVAKDDIEAWHVYSMSITSTLTITLITFFIILFFGHNLCILLNVPELEKFLFLAPITVLMRGVYLSLQYYSSRHKKFGFIGLSQISDSLTGNITCICSGILLTTSAISLIAGRIVGVFISLFTLAIGCRKNNSIIITPTFEVSVLRKIAYRYKKFPLISIWASILNTLAFVTPMLMIAHYYSTQEVGYFTLADRVLIAPLAIIGGAIAHVLFQKITELNNNNKNFDHATLMVIDKLASISVFPLIVLAITGETLFRYVFGDTWSEAGIYAQILAFYALARFVVAPLTNIVSAIEKQEIEVIFNIFFLIGRIAAVYVGATYYNIYITLALITVASILGYLLLLGFILYNSKISITKGFATIGKYFLLYSPLAITIIISDYYFGDIGTVTSTILSSMLFIVYITICNKKLLIED